MTSRRTRAAPDDADLAGRVLKAERALYDALHARGHTAEAGVAMVHGERIDFDFREVDRQPRAPPTARERRKAHKGAEARKPVVVPSGRPTLVARPADRLGGGERRWTDNGRRLEDQMDRIVLRFEAIAKAAVQSRARAEEHHRDFKAVVHRAAARLRREKAEVARPKALRALAARWEETRRLRSFLDAVEARIASDPAPEAVKAWLTWAHTYVADVDPLSNASLRKLRDDAETFLCLPEDDGEWDQDEQDWRDMGWLDDLGWLDRV